MAEIAKLETVVSALITSFESTQVVDIKYVETISFNERISFIYFNVELFTGKKMLCTIKKVDTTYIFSIIKMKEGYLKQIDLSPRDKDFENWKTVQFSVFGRKFASGTFSPEKIPHLPDTITVTF